MEIRSYAPSDIREMAALFYDTVHTVNARDYTPAQLDAWATGGWTWPPGTGPFRSISAWWRRKTG